MLLSEKKSFQQCWIDQFNSGSITNAVAVVKKKLGNEKWLFETTVLED